MKGSGPKPKMGGMSGKKGMQMQAKANYGAMEPGLARQVRKGSKLNAAGGKSKKMG